MNKPDARMIAALRSLEGLSVGDAFGECFFSVAANPLSLELHFSTRTLPNHRWRWTDDTAMAAAILEVLDRHGRIEQDDLADTFARRTPDSQTRAGIAQARDLPGSFSVETAASVLGNGSKLTAPDTVPFCLWCAARAVGDYAEAVWTTVSAGGDMDTNCAIVGGIVASAEAGTPPADWVARREALPVPIGI